MGARYMLIHEVYKAQEIGGLAFVDEYKSEYRLTMPYREDIDMIILPTERDKARLKRIAKNLHPDCKIKFVCVRVYCTRKPKANGGTANGAAR